jgi:hypothetical protein
MTTSHLTFAAWTAALAERGLTVLPSSHAVPIELWARDDEGVLHFQAQGTRVRLRRYEASDLTGLILRSECDCEEHRSAGAARRVVLRPGATPLAEAQVDGSAEFGWTGFEAGLLDVPTAAVLFDRLQAEVTSAPSADAPRLEAEVA